MTISPSQIQKVMQTYGKQVRNGIRIRQGRKIKNDNTETSASVTARAKRRQTVERVAFEIVARLVNGNFQTDSIENEILNRLSREQGESLNLLQDKATGQIVFHVVNDERGEIVRTIDQKESERLMQRLIEITKEIVDQTML